MAVVGYATLNIIPSVQGFGTALSSAIGPQLGAAGQSGGALLGSTLAKSAVAGAAGLAGVGAILYKVGETFDDVSDTIRTGTGKTGDALSDLERSAKNIGRVTPASFEDIGTTVAGLNQRLGLTGPTLEKLSRQFLEVGRITGEEVDVNKMTAAFSAFNITGEDTTTAMDSLYRVSQATGVGMNDLAASVVKGAPQLKQFGFSFEDSAAMIGVFDKAGINGDKTVQSLSRAMVQFSKEGKNPQEALRGTIKEIEGFTKAGDTAAAIRVAEKIFGTKGATQFVNAVQSGKVNIDALMQSTGATSDTILGAAADTADFAEQWQMFKNNVLLVIEPIATRLFNVLGQGMGWLVTTGAPAFATLAAIVSTNLNPALNFLQGVFMGIVNVGMSVISFFNQNRDVAIVLGSILTAILLPAMISMATSMALQAGLWTYMTVGMALYNTWQRIVTAAQWLWNAAMTANPIGLVVVALVALVGAFILAYRHSDTFRAIVQAAWAGIQTATAYAWEVIIKPVMAAFMVAVQWLGQAAMWLWQNVMAPAWTGIQVIIGVAWNIIQIYLAAWRFYIMDIIVPAIMWLWQNVVAPAFQAIGLIIQFAWQNVIWPALQAFWSIIQVLGQIAMWLWQNVMVPAWNAISAVISFVWNNIIRPAFDAFVGTMNFLGSVAMWLWHNIMEPVWTGIRYAIEVAWWAIRVVFDLLRYYVADVLAPIFMWLWQNIVIPVWNGIAAIIQWVWDNIISQVWNAMRVGIEFLANLFMWFVNNVVIPTWNLLGAGISWVVDNIIIPSWNFMRAVLDALGSFFVWIWNNVIKPIWDALGAGIAWVIDNIILPGWGAMRAGLDFLGGVFTSVWNTVIKPVWDALGAGIMWVIDNVIMPAWDKMKGALGAVGEFFKNTVNGIRDMWDGLKEAISAPIRVVIGFLGDKLGAAWRAVKSILPVLPDFPPMPGLATGGPLRGPGTGTSDSILAVNENKVPVARVSSGEFVVNKKAYDNNRNLVHAINYGSKPVQLRDGGELPGLAGGGTTWPAMFGIIHEKFPWALNNSNFRPGDSGYHGRGQALDVGAAGNNIARLSEAATWIADNFGNSTELIFGPGPNIKNGKNVGDGLGVYGASTMSQHYNHVHWANDRDPAKNATTGWLSGLGHVISGAAGAVSHFLREGAAKIFDVAMTPVNMAVDNIPGLDKSRGFGQVPGALWGTVRDKARDFIMSKADEEDSKSSGANTMGQAVNGANMANVDIMKKTAEQFGWTDFQWDALYKLEMREAGFNNLAQNPSSTAYGMGQFLDSTWAGYGPKTSDPSLQSLYMMRYIADRYGDPLAALNFHYGHNYYDKGGIANGTGFLAKNTIDPERVLSPRETVAFEQMVPIMSGLVKMFGKSSQFDFAQPASPAGGRPGPAPAPRADSGPTQVVGMQVDTVVLADYAEHERRARQQANLLTAMARI